MSVNCGDTGFVPYSLNPSDQMQVTFDISTWLGSDTIASVVYSAVDDNGDAATPTVLDAAEHEQTTTVVKPYVLGGDHGHTYTIKCLVTTTAGDQKAFYINFKCREKQPA